MTPGTRPRPGASTPSLHPSVPGQVGSDELPEGRCPESPGGPTNHSPHPKNSATPRCLGQPLGLNAGSISQLCRPPGRGTLPASWSDAITARGQPIGEDVGSLPFPVRTLRKIPKQAESGQVGKIQLGSPFQDHRGSSTPRGGRDALHSDMLMAFWESCWLSWGGHDTLNACPGLCNFGKRAASSQVLCPPTAWSGLVGLASSKVMTTGPSSHRPETTTRLTSS